MLILGHTEKTMPDVQVLRRAVRWDLTSPTFSSRASMTELKVKLMDDAQVPDVLSYWRSLTSGKFNFDPFNRM